MGAGFGSFSWGRCLLKCFRERFEKKRESEMEEWRGYFNLSGDDLKSLAFHVSNAYGPGQRFIRFFYALEDIEGYLGTLSS